MLSKNECIEAIHNWKNAKYNYSKIKDVINPQAVFNFDRQQIDWLNHNNKYKNFHVYVGIFKNKLILVVVPLNALGKELDLPAYLTSSLVPLTQELKLVEKEEITRIKTTILSQELQITSYTEGYKQPSEKHPELGQRTASQEIEMWSTECLDWFYCECNEFRGKRIFETFTVPFTDLGKPDEEISNVIGLFAFKTSPLYQRQVPTLIFTAINPALAQAQVISDPVNTNTYDWSQPCPPFCKDESTFNLLG